VSALVFISLYFTYAYVIYGALSNDLLLFIALALAIFIHIYNQFWYKKNNGIVYTYIYSVWINFSITISLVILLKTNWLVKTHTLK